MHAPTRRSFRPGPKDQVTLRKRPRRRAASTSAGGAFVRLHGSVGRGLALVRTAERDPVALLGDRQHRAQESVPLQRESEGEGEGDGDGDGDGDGAIDDEVTSLAWSQFAWSLRPAVARSARRLIRGSAQLHRGDRRDVAALMRLEPGSTGRPLDPSGVRWWAILGSNQ
ncbi:MAG: hypothetical protein HIU86_04950 [Acidobacteria bacterium]|nr:hypothetical protein [Acidobacteriota bacterium]